MPLDREEIIEQIEKLESMEDLALIHDFCQKELDESGAFAEFEEEEE